MNSTLCSPVPYLAQICPNTARACGAGHPLPAWCHRRGWGVRGGSDHLGWAAGGVVNGDLVETEQSPSGGFGAGEGAGSGTGRGRDVLAGLGESRGPVQPPARPAALQARPLPEHRVGACPQSQGSWCSPQGWCQWVARLCQRGSHSCGTCRKSHPPRCTIALDWGPAPSTQLCPGSPGTDTGTVPGSAWDSSSFPELLLLRPFSSTCPATSAEEITLLRQPLSAWGCPGKRSSPTGTKSPPAWCI